jgi:hypothetical protein
MTGVLKLYLHTWYGDWSFLLLWNRRYGREAMYGILLVRRLKNLIGPVLFPASLWIAKQNETLDFWREVSKLKDYFSHKPLGDFEEDAWESDGNFGNDNNFEDWARALWQGPPSRVIYKFAVGN